MKLRGPGGGPSSVSSTLEFPEDKWDFQKIIIRWCKRGPGFEYHPQNIPAGPLPALLPALLGALTLPNTII